MRIQIDLHHPRQKALEQAVEILKNDGVIVYPTDTVYGLGCAIHSQKAVNRIFEIKGRDKHKPMSFICSSLEQIGKYGQMDHYAFRIIRKHLPGPYTFVLEARAEAPRKLIGKRKTVGIRMPQCAVTERLVDLLGEPLVTTSANISGDEILPTGEEIEKLFGKRVDLVLDAGFVGYDPSTVIDLTGSAPIVLRPGKGDIDQFVTGAAGEA